MNLSRTTKKKLRYLKFNHNDKGNAP